MRVVVIILAFAVAALTLITITQRGQNKELIALSETAISQTKTTSEQVKRVIDQATAAVELAKKFKAKCDPERAEQ